MIKLFTLIALSLFNFQTEDKKNKVTVYETSKEGHHLTQIDDFKSDTTPAIVVIDQNQKKQTITGFGGAFTEASAYLLNQLGTENREKILKAYFAKEGANYSLTRTHMNSCDFSVSNYSYTPVADDVNLEHFSVQEDKDDLIPMIKEAMAISEDGFKIFASPWTAAPWMKDNNSWVGGKLLPKYYDTWALFFSKYVDAYRKEGIDIWGFTVENEPHGNGNSWESMIYSPQEMTTFVKNHLSPKLTADGKGELVILGYDQNREGIKEWVDEMYKDAETAQHYDGTAIHWYESTYEVFPEALQYAHNKAPNKYLIQTEACVDDEIPVWKNDAWYWTKEATDWGYTWREDEKKYLHPKYAPVNRYARDIIGCLNNWVDGWVDWNMVLDRQGGPNWKKNWCIAPVIVDPNKDEVYFTPLYYVMSHFSRFIRPGAKVLKINSSDKALQITAAENPDQSIAVVVFNEGKTEKTYALKLNAINKTIRIAPQAIQTVVIN
jgi:glucosylceramidase